MEDVRAAGWKSVTLRVRDVERVAGFYAALFGLAAGAGAEGGATLSSPGAEDPFLVLDSAPDAPLRSRRTTGLFHVAFLVPGRPALGAVLRNAVGRDLGLQGTANHGVSEALYLTDPEGNGVEVYADLPREEWPWRDGKVAMVTEPLETRRVWDAGEGVTPAETRIGHLHLSVADLDGAARFYERALGMDVTQADFPGARFLSWSGYHHHMGLNTWMGTTILRPPAGATGLVAATYQPPAGRDVTVRQEDPVGILLRATGAVLPSGFPPVSLPRTS